MKMPSPANSITKVTFCSTKKTDAGHFFKLCLSFFVKQPHNFIG